MRKTVVAMAAVAAFATWPVLAQAPEAPMAPGAGVDAGAGAEVTVRAIDPALDAETLIGRTVMSADGFEIGQVEEFTPADGGNPGFIVVSGGMLGDGIEIPVDQAGLDDTQEVVILQLTQDEVTGLTDDTTTPDAPAAPAN